MMFRKKASKTEKKQNASWNDISSIGNLDTFLPDMFEENEDYIKLGSNLYVRVIGITALPMNIYLTFFDDLMVEFSPYIQKTIHLKKIDDANVIKTLNSQIKVINSNFLSARNDENDEVYAAKVNSLKEIRKAIQFGEERMNTGTIIFNIYGVSKEDLDQRTRRFKTHCDRKTLKIRPYIYCQREMYVSSLPFMKVIDTKKSFKKSLTSRAASCMIPEGMTEFNHPNGIPLGRFQATNSLFRYDFFVGPPLLSNQMAMIFGIPGAGKSVLLKLIGCRSFAFGKLVIIFDIEGEFRKLIEDEFDGQYIDIKAGVKSGINPLDIDVTYIKETGESYIDIHSKISEVRSNIHVLCSRYRNGSLLTESEAVAIDEAVKEIYGDRGINKDPNSLYEETEELKEDGFYFGRVKKDMPTFTDLRNKIATKPNTENLVTLLRIITADGSLNLFDGQNEIDLTGGIIGIGLSNINDDFLKLYALVNILSWVWSNLKKKELSDYDKVVLIDEFWSFIRYPQAISNIEEYTRRARKYNIMFAMATHFVDDVLARPESAAILKISSTKFIMQQNVDSIPLIEETFALSEEAATSISNFNAGDALVIAGTKKAFIRTEPYEHEWPLFDTRNQSEWG